MSINAGRSGKGGASRKPRRAARSRTHPCATTTPRVRRAIQESEEKDVVLAKRFGVNRKTIAKWRAREVTSDERMGPRVRRSSLISEDELIILAYRWRSRLALNECHLRLRRLMPKLTRSTLHRCLKRHGLGRIGPTATCPPLTAAAVKGPYIFEITVHDVIFRDHDDDIGVLHQVFLAVKEVTKGVYAEVAEATPEKAAAFLGRFVNQSPQSVFAVTTNVCPTFTDWRAGFNEDMAAVGPHPFAVACRGRGIGHHRSIPRRMKLSKIRSRGVEIR